MSISHIPGKIRGEASPKGTRVLVLDADRSRATELSKRLERSSPIISVTVAASAERDEVAANDDATEFDVAVVSLEIPPRGGIWAAREFIVNDHILELVFFSTNPRSADLHAARCLGIPRIIPLEYLDEWLIEATPLLGQAARARRTLRDGLSSLPAVPLGPANGPLRIDDNSRCIPLQEAERSFREAYLGWLLAESATRCDAARRAGVPYRTLSQMISKLGIKDGARKPLGPRRRVGAP